jgi:hypothetical protein
MWSCTTKDKPCQEAPGLTVPQKKLSKIDLLEAGYDRAPRNQYPVLGSLLKNFRKTQQRTPWLRVGGRIEAASACTFGIADNLAGWLGIRFRSALNQFSRLLAKRKFETMENPWACPQSIRFLFRQLH